MFEHMNFPVIVGAGYFDAAISFRNIRETDEREVAFYELEYIPEDGGTSFINGEAYPIRRDMFICARPGDLRHTRMPFRSYFLRLTVPEGDFFDIFNSMPRAQYLGHGELIEDGFRRLIEAYSLPDENSGFVLASELLRLCVNLRHEQKNRIRIENPALSSGGARAVAQAVNYIDTHFSSRVTLEELAAQVNLSPVYFHKLFRTAVGKTPGEYLSEKRLYAAEKLLLTTDKPFVDIALECGYSSQSYFNYAFRESTGITPGAYRKRKNNDYIL